MIIKKSYKLIEYGNKEYSPFVLVPGASLAALSVAMATKSRTNAILTYRHIAVKKNLKSALRRVAWYFRRSWFAIDIIDDSNFDITEDLTSEELEILQKFLRKRENVLPPEVYHADQLYLQAYQIHQDAHFDKINHDMIAQFKHSASLLLQYCKDNASNTEKKEILQPKPKQGKDDFISKATVILHSFAKHIPNDEFPWYIISGTFLGLHREGGFLTHDIDLDFGINATDINFNLFIKALKSIPEMAIKNITNIPTIFIDNNTVIYKERPGIIKLIHNSGIQIDVFIHHLIGNKLVHGSKIHLWENTPFSLTSRTFAGINVLCPDNPDQYLTENYGDWKIPVTEFSCSTGTPNMTLSPNMFSLAFFLRKLYTHAKRGEYRQYSETLKILQEQGIINGEKIIIPFLKA